MTIILDGTAGIDNDATDLSYTGTLTGGTGVVNLGSGQVYKDASGNVGIGTSSPETKLHIPDGSITIGTPSGDAFNDRARLRIQGDVSGEGTGADAWIQIKTNTIGEAGVLCGDTDDDFAGGFIYNNAIDALEFYANNAERARIDDDGNLLVGTTSAITAGSEGVQIEPGSAIKLRLARNSTSTVTQVAFYNPNGAVGTIQTSGSSTSYNTSSDYRLKHDIAPMTGALAKVTQLKPVTYKWNTDNSESQGFIAHELQAIVPECVNGEKDAVDADGNPEYQGIDTSFLVATLTAAIQEQQALIESLTARVVALEGQA